MDAMLVSWSGAGEIERMARCDGVALIVLSNPGTIREATGRHRLDLEFWDATEVDLVDRLLLAALGHAPDRCVALRSRFRRSDWDWRPPMRADAQRIAGFVSGLPVDVGRVHVACEFGRSRSRAVAEWLGALYGTMPVGDRGGTPNPILSRLLSKVGTSVVAPGAVSRSTAPVVGDDDAGRRGRVPPQRG